MNGLNDHQNTKSASFLPAPPDGINTGVIVPRARCFEISVGIDSAKCELGGQHRGDRFGIRCQNHLLIRCCCKILRCGVGK